MPIDADDARHTVRLDGPCRASRSRSTAQIDDRLRRRRMRLQVPDDVPHREEMQRRVDQGKRGTFAGTIERAAATDDMPTLDVCRRQRTKRARHLGDAKIGQMPRFERSDPVGEHVVHVGGPIFVAAPSGVKDQHTLKA